VPVVKYLLVVLVVVLFAWWMFRPRRPAAGGAAKAPPKAEPTTPQAMLQCAHCGVHLPRAEALLDERGAFCSEAHRLAGPGPG
jgi:uncharacterized protein